MSIKKPMVLVMAGPNGSGKTTITQYFEKIGKYANAFSWLISLSSRSCFNANPNSFYIIA